MIQDAFIYVDCDNCGEVEHLGLTPLAGGGWDERDVVSELERMGWILPHGKDGDTFCQEECAEEYRERFETGGKR